MAVVVKASFTVPSGDASGGGTATQPQPMGTSVTTGVGDRLVPDFKLKVNGQLLEPAILSALRLVEIQQSIRLIDQAVLDFENHGGRISDADVFKPGNEVEVEVGYLGEIAWAFKGEIISLEPHFPVGGNPTVIVRAYDKLHRYRRGKKTRTFLNQKVSDVVTTLCSEEGLSPDVEDTQVTHEWLLQNNQTNIDLIHELGRRSGYEVEVTDQGRKLYFKKPRHSESTAALTLTWGETLKSFNVRKSLANVKTEVETRYWDMKEKKSVSETSSDLHGALACETSAPEEAQQVFGDAKLVVTLRPNSQPAEAQAFAWGLYNELALDAVRGRGTCLGEPSLAPAQILELLGLGDAWSGNYYVVKATHVLHRRAGYSTEFEVRRTGSGNVQAPDPVEAVTTTSEEREPWSRMGATVSRGGGGLTEADVEKGDDEAAPTTRHVRLRFMDEDKEPFANCPYELEVGGETYEGTTTEEGRIVCDVESEETEGEVTIWIDGDTDGESFTWPISISE